MCQVGKWSAIKACSATTPWNSSVTPGSTIAVAIVLPDAACDGPVCACADPTETESPAATAHRSTERGNLFAEPVGNIEKDVFGRTIRAVKLDGVVAAVFVAEQRLRGRPATREMLPNISVLGGDAVGLMLHA